MLTITTIKGKKMTLRMSPVTLVVYKNKFGSSLLSDFMKMTDENADNIELDETVLFQMLYAMNVTGFKNTKPYLEWLEDAWIDLSDEELLTEIVWYIGESLFPKGMKNISKKKQK